MRRPAGLEAIIVYKLTKSVAQALLGIGGLWVLARGADAAVATLAELILEHFTGAWALRVATLLVRAATARHLEVLTIALLGDAVLSAAEGLALRAGRWWAPWLVVIATALLLPWEIWHLLRHPAWGRVALVAINLAVVAYLVLGVIREQRPAEPGA
ncbi:MAG TPA: DUF2127 domain-containing protein [Myxococcales bacterium]|nr:DUF2127 domain-containing protein [Myxococcales bacterium]